MADTITPTEMTKEIAEAAEGIFNGWFADEARIDWELFFERLEAGTDWDFGSKWDTPVINAIKKHVLAYSKLGR